MQKIKKTKILFLIPNRQKHGAQNFFKRLFNDFHSLSWDKELIIEENHNKIFLYFKILRDSLTRPLIIFSTVNSNVTALFLKLLNPRITIISRLGNSISQEIKKNSLKFFIHWLFYKMLTKLSKFFVFQSQNMKEDFFNFFNFEILNYRIINNGISFPKAKIQKTIKGPKIRCLLVGTFKKQKGYDIFFKALPFIKNFSQIHIDICGDGPMLETFKNLNEVKEYLPSVTFHGFINPKKLFNQANFYVLPSRFEGFSNSLIEALSHGIPCIASNGPGASSEVIKEGLNGFLFENEDHIDLAKKIDLILSEIDSFLPEIIFNDAYQRFNINSIALKYKALLEDVRN